MVGRRLDGQPDYRYVYAKTRAECQAKLEALKQSTRSAPLPAEPRLTFGSFLERWLQDSVKPSVRPDYELPPAERLPSAACARQVPADEARAGYPAGLPTRPS